jgi:peptide/nickel transport system permease protein
VSASYLLRRVGVFLLIAWLAATLNFFLPRLTGQDPVRVKLLQQAQLGGHVQAGIDEMVKEYDRRFGLDRPLWRQYLTFLGNAARLDFNYSIANYPRTVNAMIAEALPWTVALLGTTTLVSFALGTFLGALLGWPRAPRWMRWLMPPLWALHAIPFFLLGLILIYVFAFRLPVLPMFGGYSAGAFPSLTVAFVLDLVRHAILPALSIVLVATGGWALSMRGMMVTTRRGCGAPQSSSGTACATRSCPRSRASRWRSARSSRARCWSRSSSGIPGSARSCSRRSGRTTIS